MASFMWPARLFASLLALLRNLRAPLLFLLNSDCVLLAFSRLPFRRSSPSLIDATAAIPSLKA